MKIQLIVVVWYKTDFIIISLNFVLLFNMVYGSWYS